MCWGVLEPPSNHYKCVCPLARWVGGEGQGGNRRGIEWTSSPTSTRRPNLQGKLSRGGLF